MDVLAAIRNKFCEMHDERPRRSVLPQDVIDAVVADGFQVPADAFDEALGDLRLVEVVSDGVYQGTSIKINGEPVANVTSLKYEVSVDSPWATLTITMAGQPFSAVGLAAAVESQV